MPTNDPRDPRPEQQGPAGPEAPRAAPPREPYYEGYFGTEEEEGVVREQDDAEVGDGADDEEPGGHA